MKSILRELAWLLACAAASFVLTGALLGYRVVLPGNVLEIQMHNTYFVLGWWLVLLPLFLVAAVPLTLVRAAQEGFRQQATNAVLAGLALLTLLLLVPLGFWAEELLHKR